MRRGPVCRHGTLSLLGGLSLLLAACATDVPTASDDNPRSRLAYPTRAASLNDHATLQAFHAEVVGDGGLIISYRDGKRTVTVGGQLTPPADPETVYPDPLPSIVYFETVRDRPSVQTERVPVAIRSSGDWDRLLHELLHEMARLVPDEGVVLDVLRRDEVFLYVDADGELRAVPIQDKPPAVRPVRVVTLTGLLNEAAGRLRRALRPAVGGDRYLLFNTGDVPDTGFPFVFLDLDRGLVYFLQWSRDDGQVVGQAPSLAVQAAIHTLSSQIDSVANRPLSSFTRALGSIGFTAVDYLRLPPALVTGDGAIPPLSDDPPMDLQDWEAELDRLLGAPATHGRIRYLVDGGAFFPALIHALGGARHAVRLRLYIFDNDDYALKIADLLKRRSQDVDIRVLVDGIGTLSGGMARPASVPLAESRGPDSIVRYLKQDAAVDVRVVSNLLLQGDHTKVVIVDDDVAYLGGMNIGREYRYEWHDLMVAVTGPVVDRLIVDFDTAWRHEGLLGDLQLATRRPARAERAVDPGEYPVRLLYTRPMDAQILRTQLAAIRSARDRVWIQNAYLTSDRILGELVRARHRGVDVRVILPFRNDTGVIGRSNVLAANYLLRHGARVYIYPGMSHVKAALYDGWACLGSANFDRLSLRLNKETNIATSDPDAVEDLRRAVFDPDFARSLELHEPLPASWLDYLSEAIADHL